MTLDNRVHHRAAYTLHPRLQRRFNAFSPSLRHPRFHPPGQNKHDHGRPPGLFNNPFDPPVDPPPSLAPSFVQVVDPPVTPLTHPSTAPHTTTTPNPTTNNKDAQSPTPSFQASSSTPEYSSSETLTPSSASTSGLHQAVTSVAQVAVSSSAGSTKPSVAGASSNGMFGSSAGPIAGGVVVGALALAAFICVLVFFVRRSRRYSEDQFDVDEFRRSAVLMSDPPTHKDTITRGFNPHPPTMAEHGQPSSSKPTFGKMYGPPTDSYPNTPTSHGFGAGGNIYYSTTLPPPSPGTYATAGHYQPGDQVTPIVMGRPPSSRRPSRPASGNDPGAANGFTFPRRPPSKSNTVLTGKQELNPAAEQPPLDDYVDLTRSSVSPFQAAQYVEISRKLNTKVPRGLHENDPSPTKTVNGPPVPSKSPTESMDNSPPPVPPKSPFEDPEQQESIRESRSSGQSALRGQTPELQDFPVPPSPVPTVTSRYRMASILPESDPENHRSSLYSTTPLPSPFVSKRKSVIPKYQSSPLASSGVVSNEANNKLGAKKDETDKSKNSLTGSEAVALRRPETVYNPDDVYGGI